MNNFLRRFFAVGATLLALATASVALATPTISFVTPTSGSTLGTISSPAGFTITATAAPTSGATIASTQFFDNGVSLGVVGGTTPSIVWIPTTAGTHTLTATVTDSAATSNTATATSIVTVSTVRTVTILAPTNNLTVAGNSSFVLRSNPVLSDSVVASVQFRIDGVDVGSLITQAPYNTAITLPTLTTGAHTITAFARDGGTIDATSASTTINIAPAIGAAPTVSLTSPGNASTVLVGQNVTLSATATDSDGFIPATAGGGVTFYVDGDPIVPTVTGETNPDLSPAYSITWKPTVAKTYTLLAQTIDDKNNIVLSSPVTVTATSVTTPPTITLTSPTAGSSFAIGTTVPLTATATANGGASVTRVDFLSGTTVLGNATASPYTFNWVPATAGTFSITARVTDSNSSVVTSTAASVTILSSAPTVSITSPTNGTSIPLGTSRQVDVTAVANGGATVGRVDLLAGTTIVSTLLTPTSGSTYSFTYTPTASGVTALTARVTDSNATAVTSSVVNVNVTAPTVAITSPTAGSTVTVNTATNLTASFTTPGSTANKVEFFSGTTLVGTVTSPAGPTASVSWTPTATGTVSLTARVTDNNGAAVTSTAVSVTVAPSGLGVTITAPTANSTVVGNTLVTVSATATVTSPATIANVTFFMDNLQIGGADTTAPYAISWSATSPGLHTLTAVVTDNNGNTATSPGVNVTVSAFSLPTVSLTAPAFAASALVGSPVTVSATAAPGSTGSITRVDFFADNQNIGTDTTSPYSITWTPTTAGFPSIYARVTDSNNVTSNSVPVSIIVNASGTPTITLASVGGGGSLIIPVGSSRMLVGTTADDGVVAKVDFYLDGKLIGTDGVAPYTFTYTADDGDLGAHQFTAIVTDNSGLTTTSAPVNFTVVAAIGSAPTVRVLTPADGAFAAAGAVTTINVVAADSDGTISRVEVFANGILLGNTTLSTGIWSTAWTPTTSGPVSIVAIATDDKTNATSSIPANVTVTDSTAPTLALGVTPGTNGATGTTLPAGATRNVVATVNSNVAGRAITRVEFYINGSTKVGEKTIPPYSYRFTAPSTPGIYVLNARAIDNAGLARDVYYTFNVTSAVGVAPTLRLLTPTNNVSVVPNTPVTMAASAVATGGTIANVQFYADGAPVGNPIAPPATFTTTYTPTTPGTHVLDAIATDDRGNTTISTSVNLLTAFGTPTIVISSPSTNVTARATPNVPFSISATATAGTGAAVFLVEFLVDGTPVGSRGVNTAASSLYTFQWTPTSAQLGTHQITARITDTNSLTATTTTPLNVNVANPVGAPPTMSAISPANAAVLQSLSTVNFSVNVAAGSNATITSVEFFLNDIRIGSGAREQSTNVYRLVYDLSNFDLSGLTINETTGRYPVNYYAIARDSNNNQTIFPAPTATNPTPAILNISPSISSAPTVSLQSAIVGGGANAVTIGTSFFMNAFPADNDGTVTSMQLFVNGTLSGGTILNPQNPTFVTYTPTTAGTYNLYVVATDDTGNTAVSSPNVVLQVSAIQAPTTQLVRPADNTVSTTVGAPVFLEATAAGQLATQIPTVVFLASASTGARTTINATRVGTTNQYRAIWSPTVADTYTIVSQAVVGSSPTFTSQVSRQVVVNNLLGIAPTVTISVPGTVSSASTLNLTATANDSDGSVSSVEFYLNRISIGFATRDQLTATWRLTASVVGQPLGSTEIVALVRDSSGNVAASPTSLTNIVAATSLAPTFTTITATPSSVATGRQMQFTANARDTDGTVTVQYFANGVSLGTSGNANTSYLVNWTPSVSGQYTISAVATDNSTPANTAVATPIQVTVRRNNPIQDDTSFIIQSYSDIANTTTINPLVLADLADRLGAGTLKRSDIVIDLLDQPGFVAPVNLLATYYVLMGQWPTPTNYTALLATARGSLSGAVTSILNSNEYFAKYGIVPTAALLNSPTSALPADTFINQLWLAAGLGNPSALNNLQFRNNTTTTATLGRGYTVAGLNVALAEFITNTNSTNTPLFAKAKAAALYYQIDRPSSSPSQTAKDVTDAIAVRVSQLVAMPDDATRINSLLNDVLYTYRYVTFVKHPQSLVLAPRSGAIFSVEATGAPPILYQWLFNGTPIAGATTSTLSLTNVDTTRVGTYNVVVTTTAGSATSDPATLTLTNTPTRVANISTRGVTNGGNQILIGGFVVANPTGAPANQTRQMLIRVVGPTLTAAPFNFTGALGNPQLEVFNAAGQSILTNDNWGTQNANAAANTTAVQALTQATTRVGAFSLVQGSQDAAILATLTPGSYTVQARGPAANSSGVVLIEVYDATATVATATSPKASNVATRGEVGTGNNVLIAGFVINGAASRRMLIRGVGPTLRNFGIGQNAVLADPIITLKDAAGTTIKINDDWASGDDAANIAAAATASGAFALANGSKDAAMLVMLAPGAYTVQLAGVNNGTGIGIVEVYDVDP